jgi:hypothetical protein
MDHETTTDDESEYRECDNVMMSYRVRNSNLISTQASTKEFAKRDPASQSWGGADFTMLTTAALP